MLSPQITIRDGAKLFAPSFRSERGEVKKPNLVCRGREKFLGIRHLTHGVIDRYGGGRGCNPRGLLPPQGSIPWRITAKNKGSSRSLTICVPYSPVTQVRAPPFQVVDEGSNPSWRATLACSTTVKPERQCARLLTERMRVRLLPRQLRRSSGRGLQAKDFCSNSAPPTRSFRHSQVA